MVQSNMGKNLFIQKTNVAGVHWNHPKEICIKTSKTIFLKAIHVRGAFGKFLAWSCVSVTDLQTLSCLVPF